MTMQKGNIQLITRMRAMCAVLVLAMCLSVAAPRQTHAATGQLVSWGLCALLSFSPPAQEFCKSVAASAIAQAIGSVIDTLIPGFVTRIQILTGQRIATAQMTNQQGLLIQEANHEDIHNNTPSVTRARCSVASVAALGAGAMPIGPGQVSPRPRARVTVPPNGRFPRVALPENRDQGATGAAVELSIASQGADALMCRRTGNCPDGVKPLSGTPANIADHNDTMRYRPCIDRPPPEREKCIQDQEASGSRPYADISAESLFGADTLGGDTDSKVVQETRMAEAFAYCANLIVPGSPPRAAGNMTSDRAISEAVQRAGDARVALAVKMCADAVGRRAPIAFNAGNPAFNWVVAAACAYRTAFTGLRGEGATGNASFDGAINRACQNEGSPQGSNNIYFSRLELMRIMSRDIFTTGKFSVNTASSNPAELQRMMVAMESINAQVNFEILRMQEQLNLIQSARLALSVQQ